MVLANKYDIEVADDTRRGRSRYNPVLTLCLTACLLFWTLVIVGGMVLF
jgi:hypothetical protein